MYSLIFNVDNNQFTVLGKNIDELRIKWINLTDAFERDGFSGDTGVWNTIFGSTKEQLIPETNLIEVLSFDKAKNQLDQFNNLVVNGKLSAEQYFNTIGRGNDVLKNYVTTTEQQNQSVQGLIKASQDARNAQIDHNASLQQGSIAAKAGQLALKGLAMVGNMLLSWALIKGVELAAKAIYNYINRVEIAKEKTIDLLEEYESITSEIETLEGKLEELNAQIGELDPVTDEQDIANLKLETAELNAQLAILREKQALTKQGSEAAAKDSLTMTQGSKYALEDTTYTDWTTGITFKTKGSKEVTSYEELDLAMKAYDGYKQKVLELNEEMANIEDKSSDEYLEKAKDLEDFSKRMNDARVHANDLAASIQPQLEALPEDSDLRTVITAIINGYVDWTDKINTSTDALKDNAEAVNGVAKETHNILDNSASITSSVQQIAKQLEPQFAKLGEAYKSIFTSDGFTLDNVDNSMLEDLRTTFTEIGEEIGVTFDSNQLEPFFDALTNKSGTSVEQAERVQQAFNNLATSYFYSTDTLDKLNESTAEAIQKQLEELNVVNAKEVVYDTLKVKTEAVALQEQFLAENGYALSEATHMKALMFLNEAGASETARQYLFMLVTQEKVFGKNNLSTEQKIKELEKLALAYGQTAMAASIANYEYQKSMTLAIDPYATFDDESFLNEMQTQINNGISQVKVDMKAIDDNASKSGKEAADAYKESFEKELKALQDLRDRGVIDESTYLDRLRELYIRYFADREKYLDDFNKYEREYLEGMESLYNSALSAIVKFKDEKIDAVKEEKDKTLDALEEEKDARLDVIDAQKEQLEVQLDLIDKQIEAKEEIIDGIQGEIDLIQDEIDAMREANDERKRQIDLQKAQYDLERMQNQRINLIYKDGQMVYENDESGIRDAREAVSDAQLEIDIAEKEKEIAQKEKQIDLIEKEIELFEKQKDAINEQIETLEKQTQSIEKYYDTLIEQQEKFYDSMIESLEKEKSAWEELAEVKEVADTYSAIEQVFGDLGYTVEDVLNNSSGVFEDFKTKYIDLLNVMNSNESFGNGLSYAVDELDKSLSNAGTNTEGLDNLVSKMDEVASSVGNVSNAINGSGISAMATGEETIGTGTNLKDALAEQTSDAIAKLEEQSNAFSGGEESLEGSVQNVINKVAGSSEEGENKDSKEKESEADTSSLIGAIQAQYDKTVEAVPQQIQYFVDLKNSIVDCVTELNNMITALETVQTLSSAVTVGGLPSIPQLADGTTHAKKGLTLVGEEKPELIEDTKGNLSLAAKPTLLNMKGGEKVYNGAETEKLLKPLDKSSATYAMLMKSKSLINSEILSPANNILSRQVDGMVNTMKSVQPISSASQNVNLSIGDIQLHGVQDVNGLANAISTKLPNMLLQTITKRN